MKFNRLQASISNNADQSPSLYMAFCAVESLFADLEDNCGSEISLCPVGDERLPSKLVWLCRIINEIYRDNSEELQRNRSRLDAAMEKLNETREKLEESASEQEKLEKIRAEYAVLEKRLQGSSSAAEEYEKLSAKCRQAKQTLEQLGTFDFSATEEELKKMTADIASKESAKSALQAELKCVCECADGLQREIDGLQAGEQDAKRQLLALQEQHRLAVEENARLSEELNRLEKELIDFGAEKNQLIAKGDEAQQNIELLKGKIAEYREEDLTAKYAELEVVKKEMEQLEDELGTYDSECSRIKEQRGNLIMDIAHKKTESESLSEKLVLAQQKCDKLEREKLCLAEDLSECTQVLEVLQAEVDEFTQKKLPEVKKLQAQELLRKTELQQAVAETENQLASLQDEITKLNDVLPKLEEEVNNNRVVYDALTASCATSSNELESLERQIEELRNNTDEQKIAVYRKQLEEKQQELESIQLECEQMKKETSELGIRLEQMQEERARLRDLKNRHEQGVTVTEKQLRELEFVVNEKYVQEVAALEGQAKLIESVRGKLADSIANMQKILGDAPVTEPISLEDQLKHILRELRLKIDDLRCSLVECAHSLKMEER